MLLLLTLLASDPLSRWQVPFNPEIVLVRGDGQSILILDRDLYIYDRDGTPRQNVTLDFDVEQAWVGPDDRVLVHDGIGILGALNESYNLSWQREVAPPLAEPFISGELLVYATGNDVLLLHPDEGQARFSRRMPRAVTAVTALDDWLLISDGEENVLAWSPFSGLERLREEGNGDIDFAARGPEGALALAFAGGLLEVTPARRRARWRRDHHIDIAVQPLWLAMPRRSQLLVATLGRRIHAYGARGRRLASTLLPARIMDLIAFPGGRVLIVARQYDQLTWYDAASLAFTREPLPGRLRHLAHRGDFVLMVDEDGMIALYDKRVDATD